MTYFQFHLVFMLLAVFSIKTTISKLVSNSLETNCRVLCLQTSRKTQYCSEDSKKALAFSFSWGKVRVKHL